MDDIYKNTEEYNPRKNWKTIIVIDDTIVDMLGDKKLNPTVTTLFIRSRKHFFSLYFTILFKFTEKYQTKIYGLFNYETSNKQELKKIAFNLFLRIDFQDFTKNVL